MSCGDEHYRLHDRQYADEFERHNPDCLMVVVVERRGEVLNIYAGDELLMTDPPPIGVRYLYYPVIGFDWKNVRELDRLVSGGRLYVVAVVMPGGQIVGVYTEREMLVSTLPRFAGSFRKEVIGFYQLRRWRGVQ